MSFCEALSRSFFSGSRGKLTVSLFKSSNSFSSGSGSKVTFSTIGSITTTGKDRFIFKLPFPEPTSKVSLNVLFVSFSTSNPIAAPVKKLESLSKEP